MESKGGIRNRCRQQKDLKKQINKLEERVLIQGKVIERLLDFLKDLGLGADKTFLNVTQPQ